MLLPFLCGISGQCNSSIGGSSSSRSFSGSQRRHSGPIRVACSSSSSSAPSTKEPNGSVLMETPVKGSTVADIHDHPTPAGGVKDVYGEDRATEDQFVTPWSVSVAT